MNKPKIPLKTEKKCQFCEEKASYIDYKNLKFLYYFLSEYRKIKPRYYTGVCLNHQKKLSRAVKNARIMALIPFVARFR